VAWLLWVPLLLADVPAPPAIEPGGIVNAASLMPATLAGGALAPGARCRIPGVRLGPAVGVRGSESDPPVRLADVSVRITQGDRGLDAGLLFVSAERIDAWIPADAPPGEARLTVTYQGRTSEPYPLTLAASGVGFFADDPPVAAPGETIALRATGLGRPALDLFVGGRPAARVRYSTEACCRGIERIEFQVPPDAPLGCSVPVAGRTPEGRPTNVVPIAIHPPGRPCRDAVDWFRESVEHTANAGFFVLARISLDSGLVMQYRFDYALASFARQEQGQRVFPPLPPPRTCTGLTARVNLRRLLGQARSPAEWTSMPEKTSGSRRLDAGPALRISGPSGARTVDRDARQHEYYSGILAGAPPFSRTPPLPWFLEPGPFTVSAPGGADIGAFSIALNVSPRLVWKNRGGTAEVRRSRGVTVTWKSARRDTAILILAANADRFSGDSALCLCMAPARDGRFTIPPLALANLPPTTEETELSASYMVLLEMPLEPPARIQAAGLDGAFGAFVSASARLVRYR
jgi:uncharacterized protein (TIGR03437 family)